jgi:iron complex outermembrane receptor protein
LLFAVNACVGSPAASTNDLAELSLEDLMRVKITSVSKRPEVLGGAAAAIHLITGDDVRREGFLNLADSLRYVPGMQVAQINSHSWGVSARGFNAEYATKLLVLLDGRSVYTPLNAGVYWDTLDLMLEDLDRIEVIRGPGGTLWGANAVNGVINITSKSARDTQGWLVTGGGGTEEHGFAGARYGGHLGAETFYRIYGKYDNHDELAFANGARAGDAWQLARTGFRLDSGSADADLLTLQGDLFHGAEDWLYTQPIAAAPFTQTVPDHERVFGANLLGRWTHTFDSEAQFILQTYYDHTDRESNLPNEQRDTYDVDLQHHFVPFGRHNLVAGLGYRLTTDRIRNSYANGFTPPNRSLQLFSGFVQDEVTLIEDRLRFTLGSKLEHNDFTGLEYQPSVRLAWTPSDAQTIWTSVSRAVRTPSRAEDDVRVNRSAPGLPGSVVSLLGHPGGESEKLMAYEIGYRTLPLPKLSFDVAAFYHDYDELRSLELGPNPPTPPVPVATYYVQNKLKGTSWGLELASDWQLLDWWRWRGTYTYFQLDLDFVGGGTDLNTIQLLEGNAPRHQFTLRSQMDLPYRLEFDTGLRYVDHLANPRIPSYLTMDVRLSWRPNPNLEISVVGLNLLEARHAEFAATQVVTPQREVQRSVYGKISWRF